MSQTNEKPNLALWTKRIDWLPLVVALAGFALAWFARNVMAGDIATRAQIVGFGKVVGYLGILFYIVQLVRRR